MTTRSLRRVLGALLGTALLSAAAVGIAAPASAAPAAHGSSQSFRLNYVALGDSYAAGQGVEPYSDTTCLRSTLSYPVLLDVAPRVQLRADVACTGAKIGDLSTQLDQAGTGALRSAKLITLTVGANDLGTSDLAGVCVAAPSSCLTLIAAAEALIPQVEGTLPDALRKIKAEAPRAKVVVTGYPLLFNESAFTGTQALLVHEVNEAILLLNAAIQRAAGKVPHVVYVDVVGAFAGHEVGSASPWIAGPGTTLDPKALFHPNALGQAAYAMAVARAAL